MDDRFAQFKALSNLFLEDISMNTLSRQRTASFFSLPSDYDTFRLHWCKLVNTERKHEFKAVHHLAILVLCGKDWRKAFTTGLLCFEFEKSVGEIVYNII